MDLSWPLPSSPCVNGGMPSDTYLGVFKKMRLPSAQDLTSFTRKVGSGGWLLHCGVTRAYCQLPVNPADWPLVCYKKGGGGCSWMLASPLV